MIVSKLVAGITAIFVAMFMANRVLGKQSKTDKTEEKTDEGNVAVDEH